MKPSPPFDAEYRLNRQQATSNLLHQLVLIQNCYRGSLLDSNDDSEPLRIRAIALNRRLIDTAGFGTYSNAEKINILYRLRNVLEKLLETHFEAAKPV